MTHSALTSSFSATPPFDRIDLAPMPQSAYLRRVLAFWQDCRGAAVLPAIDCFTPAALAPLGPNPFLCSLVDGGRDYCLQLPGEGLTKVIPTAAKGTMLSQHQFPAVPRLQRLFDMVVQCAEPACGAFNLGVIKGEHLYVELLAAPVGDGDHKVSAVFGGIAFRHPSAGWDA